MPYISGRPETHVPAKPDKRKEVHYEVWDARMWEGFAGDKIFDREDCPCPQPPVYQDGVGGRNFVPVSGQRIVWVPRSIRVYGKHSPVKQYLLHVRRDDGEGLFAILEYTDIESSPGAEGDLVMLAQRMNNELPTPDSSKIPDLIKKYEAVLLREKTRRMEEKIKKLEAELAEYEANKAEEILTDKKRQN